MAVDLPDLEGGIPAVASPHSAPVSVAIAIDGREWDGYVASQADATHDHLWGWREIVGDVFKQDCRYLVARRGSTVRGVLPLVLFRSRLFGRFGVSVPYLNYGGLLASDRESAVALIDAAVAETHRFGGSHVELRHQARRLSEAPVRTHKLRMVRDLPSRTEDLWTAIDRKVRNQIRKAQKEGLTAETGSSELLDSFYSVFAENMRDLGTPVHSRRLFQAVMSSFGQAAQIHVVRYRGAPAAASLTLRFRDTVLVPWASSRRELRSLCPNMLLYWHMLASCVETGATVFDFGRSTAGAGTHHFKLQWGAREIPLHWEYVLLTAREAPDYGPTSAKASAAVEVWKKLPLWVANLIGPRVIENIP